MKCEVKKKNSCTFHTKEECNIIEYVESDQKPFKTCEPEVVHVPKQNVDHKKKCLKSQYH